MSNDRTNGVPRRRLAAGAALLAVAGGAMGGVAGGAARPASAQSGEFTSVLVRYADLLRANDADGLAALFTPDGIFMRENMPAAVGRAAIRAAFVEVFATLKLDLAFDIRESETDGTLAWLRATSRGRIRVLPSGSDGEDSFNVLAVLRRLPEGWRIRSYLYATDRPGRGPAK